MEREDFFQVDEDMVCEIALSLQEGLVYGWSSSWTSVLLWFPPVCGVDGTTRPRSALLSLSRCLELSLWSIPRSSVARSGSVYLCNSVRHVASGAGPESP